MEALRDAYLLNVDQSSRPLQRFQEGSRLLKAAEEIVAVAQGLQKEFWDFWILGHEARYLEIMRGLQESGDAVGAVIFARRYEGWAYFGEDARPRPAPRRDRAAALHTGPLRGRSHGDGPSYQKRTMMPLERRNEPQMLRQFQKMYPSYNLNPLMRRRHQQLVEAQASQPVAGEPEAAAGGRDLRGRNRSDDGSGEPTNPAAKVRAGRPSARASTEWRGTWPREETVATARCSED